MRPFLKTLLQFVYIPGMLAISGICFGIGASLSLPVLVATALIVLSAAGVMHFMLSRRGVRSSLRRRIALWAAAFVGFAFLGHFFWGNGGTQSASNG